LKLKCFLFAICVAFLAPDLSYSSGNETNQFFYKAKKLLLGEVYSDHHATFYCGARFDNAKIITEENGYVPVRDNARSRRIEWEHIVPAHAFGQSFREWRDGDQTCVSSKGKSFKGRRCAEKLNTTYRYMQSDMT
jgi:deoxyribonuclease-1